MLRRSLFWILLLLGLPGLAAAPAPEPGPAQIQRVNEQLKAQPAPLQQLKVLDSACASTDRTMRDFACQRLAVLLSQLGDYDRAARVYPFGSSGMLAGAELPQVADGWQAQPAAQAIAALAKDRRLVMLNEAHHIAQTRTLTLELLPLLRRQGFSHFAMEALSASDTDISTRGYPSSRSGNHISEPIMGELVRHALALGYVLVPYECTIPGADASTREREQSRQLYERSFATDANARVLVHAGYAHVHEAEGYLFKVQPLAMQLREKTGFDPLTIDQTVLRADAPEREHPGYRALLALNPAGGAAVMVNAAGAPWSLSPSHFDVSVILPDPPVREGRPGWLTLGGTRAPYPIPAALCGDVRPCLVEARLATQEADATRTDRLLIRAGDPVAALMLPEGRYHLSAAGEDGELQTQREVTVKAIAKAQP